MTVERLKAVMMHHREFRELPAAAREEAWQAGVHTGAAVMRAKLENCRCGNEQFDIAFGAKDMARMVELFASQGRPPRSMCRISVVEWNKAFEMVDANTMADFIQLTSGGPGSPLQELVRTEDGYRLTTLLAVFAFSGQPALNGVAQRYLRALKRRLLQQQHTTLASAEVAEARVRQGLQDAEKLSKIMHMFAEAV